LTIATLDMGGSAKFNAPLGARERMASLLVFIEVFLALALAVLVSSMGMPRRKSTLSIVRAPGRGKRIGSAKCHGAAQGLCARELFRKAICSASTVKPM
jgi:hypothetical protein